jgi:hypothetical protein
VVLGNVPDPGVDDGPPPGRRPPKAVAGIPWSVRQVLYAAKPVGATFVVVEVLVDVTGVVPPHAAAPTISSPSSDIADSHFDVTASTKVRLDEPLLCQS